MELLLVQATLVHLLEFFRHDTMASRLTGKYENESILGGMGGAGRCSKSDKSGNRNRYPISGKGPRASQYTRETERRNG